MKKTIILFILYLAIINIITPKIVPSKLVYNHRLNFDIVKNRVTNIDAVLGQIRNTIKQKNFRDYVIIIGDSVSYGSPGPAHGSIGYHLNKIAQAQNVQIVFFNLSMPSMQTGDIYTILLKLNKYGLSSKNIIININYSSFVKRTYGHPVATWFYNELRRLDYTSYKRVENNLLSETETLATLDFSKKTMKQSGIFQTLHNEVYTKINIFKYKDYLQSGFLEVYNAIRGRAAIQTKVQPWFAKVWLKDYMKEEEIQWGLSDSPFVLDSTNEDIFFIEKIIEMQKNSNLLIYMAALNRELLKEETSKIEFNNNLAKLDMYFSQKKLDYINFDSKINYKLFSDHIHLTPEGYLYMANKIWHEIKHWEF